MRAIILVLVMALTPAIACGGHRADRPVDRLDLNGESFTAVMRARNQSMIDGPKIEGRTPVGRYEIKGEFLTPDRYSLLQWGLRRMLDGQSYDETFGDAPRDVIVAIIDSNIGTMGHPDIQMMPGWDFVDGDGDTVDPSSTNFHGQCVASILAATHNTIGIAGAFHRAQILPIRSDFWTFDQAIDFAASNADMIQVSGGLLSGGPHGEPIFPLHGAAITGPYKNLRMIDTDEVTDQLRRIRLAIESAGIPIVAGESNQTMLSTPNFIASRSEVIVSGPVNIHDEIMQNSSFTMRYDVLSPGGSRAAHNFTSAVTSLYSTNAFPDRLRPFSPAGDYDDILCAWGSGYALFNGGSASIPHTSAAVAAILSYLPGTTTEDIRRLLKTSGEPPVRIDSLMDATADILSYRLLMDAVQARRPSSD